MNLEGRLSRENLWNPMFLCAASPLNDLLLVFCFHMDKPCLCVSECLEGCDAIVHQTDIRPKIRLNMCSVSFIFSKMSVHPSRELGNVLPLGIHNVLYR